MFGHQGTVHVDFSDIRMSAHDLGNFGRSYIFAVSSKRIT